MSGLPKYQTTIIDDWIDYNDHLSEAFYVLIFGYATDAVMEQIGLGRDERTATGSSLYTVEAHIRYLQEVTLGAEVSVTSRIVGAGPKKLHLAHEMTARSRLVATEEILALHVAGEPAAARPFPAGITERITDLIDTGPRPDWLGRSID